MDVEPLVLWAALLANFVFLPVFVYLIVVSLAALSRTRKLPPDRAPRLRFQVIIPAHDEEAGIAATVRSCRQLDYPGDLFEVVVIADNCADQTAALARQEGATVVERVHTTDRSKGYALKFWFDRLSETGRMEQLDAVVVIDADTVADPQLLRGFARHLEDGQDWIQAFDTVANTGDSWRTRLMTYSFGLINGVLLQGQTAMGLSGGFRGNGMCCSTRGLRRCPWKNYGLVEDLEYSWSIRIAGEKIAFAPEAVVRATMLAHGGAAAASQRRRWEFGRSQLKRRMLGPLLRSRHLGWPEKAAAVVELCMPTLVMLTSFFALSMTYSLHLFLNPSDSSQGPLSWTLLGFQILATCGLMLYGLAPFLLFPLRWDILIGLAHFPLYALWKFATVFHRPPSQWIRTAREPDSSVLSCGQAGTTPSPRRGPTEVSVLGPNPTIVSPRANWTANISHSGQRTKRRTPNQGFRNEPRP